MKLFLLFPQVETAVQIKWYNPIVTIQIIKKQNIRKKFEIFKNVERLDNKYQVYM